jgi:hypothetical protein
MDWSEKYNGIERRVMSKITSLITSVRSRPENPGVFGIPSRKNLPKLDPVPDPDHPEL